MGKSTKFDGLLHKLCVGWGFCGGDKRATDLLPPAGSITASEFADFVLHAEGAQPLDSLWQDWHEKIAKEFLQIYGHEPIDVADLKAQP